MLRAFVAFPTKLSAEFTEASSQYAEELVGP